MSGEVRLDAATCPRCRGCGQIASGDEGAPWSDWLALPLGSSLAVLAGIVKPISCPTCNGTGKRAALSDWVRACEGTGLGEPCVAANQGDSALCVFFDLGGRLGGDPFPRRDDVPDVYVEIDPTEARVYAARDEGGLTAKCTTPTDLRAALEALALAVPS